MIPNKSLQESFDSQLVVTISVDIFKCMALIFLDFTQWILVKKMFIWRVLDRPEPQIGCRIHTKFLCQQFVNHFVILVFLLRQEVGAILFHNAPKALAACGFLEIVVARPFHQVVGRQRLRFHSWKVKFLYHVLFCSNSTNLICF